jgi:lysophospholipase L1-like esterase
MSGEGEAGGLYRAPRPHRLLSRLTVFVLGLAIGAGAGAIAATGYLVAQGRLVAPATGGMASAAGLPPAKPGPAAIKVAPSITGAGPRANPAAFYPTVSPPLAVGRPLVVGVFGDSLGDGLWAGLYHQLREDKRFSVVKFSQPSTGLTRYDYVDVQQHTEEQIAGRAIDVAVIMFGTNDQQGIIADDGVQAFGSPGWRAAYDRRIENLVGTLRAKGIAVYWVGLPRMERDRFDQGAAMINQIYADEARALNVPFIPTTTVTQDESGDYAAYLKVSAAGRPVLMRAKDGIHMTMEGYLRIAAPVAARLRADAAAAEAQHAANAPPATPPVAGPATPIAVTPTSGPVTVSR